MSTNTLGNGYVECVSDGTLTAIREGQAEDMRGTAPEVPVLEGDASPISMKLASPVLFPYENTSSGRFLGFGSRYDDVSEFAVSNRQHPVGIVSFWKPKISDRVTDLSALISWNGCL